MREVEEVKVEFEGVGDADREPSDASGWPPIENASGRPEATRLSFFFDSAGVFSRKNTARSSGH